MSGRGWRPARWRRSTPTTSPRPRRWRPEPMPDTILVLNAGSSSIKFQLFGAGGGGDLTRLLRGQIGGIGTARPRLSAQGARGRPGADREIPPPGGPRVGGGQEGAGG